jgi:hypothetical protein
VACSAVERWWTVRDAGIAHSFSPTPAVVSRRYRGAPLATEAPRLSRPFHVTSGAFGWTLGDGSPMPDVVEGIRDVLSQAKSRCASSMWLDPRTIGSGAGRLVRGLVGSSTSSNGHVNVTR